MLMLNRKIYCLGLIVIKNPHNLGTFICTYKESELKGNLLPDICTLQFTITKMTSFEGYLIVSQILPYRLCVKMISKITSRSVGKANKFCLLHYI